MREEGRGWPRFYFKIQIRGAPPPKARKFSLSYGWASQFHPSPTGSKMRELAAALEKLGADDGDAVFFDYCALPQNGRAKMPDAYFEANGCKAPMADKTAAEKQQFGDENTAWNIVHPG